VLLEPVLQRRIDAILPTVTGLTEALDNIARQTNRDSLLGWRFLRTANAYLSTK
jgi:hypothetical protein